MCNLCAPLSLCLSLIRGGCCAGLPANVGVFLQELCMEKLKDESELLLPPGESFCVLRNYKDGQVRRIKLKYLANDVGSKLRENLLEILGETGGAQCPDCRCPGTRCRGTHRRGTRRLPRFAQPEPEPEPEPRLQLEPEELDRWRPRATILGDRTLAVDGPLLVYTGRGQTPITGEGSEKLVRARTTAIDNMFDKVSGNWMGTPSVVGALQYTPTEQRQRPRAGNQRNHTNWMSQPRAVSPRGRERAQARPGSPSPDRARSRTPSPTRPRHSGENGRVDADMRERSPRPSSPPASRPRGRGQSVAYGPGRPRRLDAGPRFRD